MKILLVASSYLPDGRGGVELALARFAKWAQAAGHEVLVFRRCHEPERDEFELRRAVVDGVPVVSLNYRFGDATDFSYLLNNRTIRARFEEVMRAYSPTVVHVHHLTCLTTEIVEAGHDYGVPVVLTLHDYWMGCPRGQRLTRDWQCCETVDVARCGPCYRETWSHWFPGAPDPTRERQVFEAYRARVAEVLDRADALLVPSPFAREVFVRDGVPRERMRVVENGMDASLYGAGGCSGGRSGDRSPGRSPDAPAADERAGGAALRVGFMGTLLPSKGVHILIDAFCRAGIPGSTLDIHGPVFPYHGDTTYERHLRELAAPRATDIAFHGPYEADDAPRILSALDVLVVPSIWYETYCMVIREAFLAGVAVIASDFGAMADAIIDGETGLLSRVGDAADLAEKIRRLAGDPSLRARLARSPKRVATVATNAAATMAVYEDLLDRPVDG